MSRISITGIRAIGYHGVLEEERTNGQEFVVDALLDVDTSKAEVSDDVNDTVHYGLVAQAIHNVVIGASVNLIETLAAQIAEIVLTFEGVQSVAITVHKPQAPIPVPFADVSVTVERSR